MVNSFRFPNIDERGTDKCKHINSTARPSTRKLVRGKGPLMVPISGCSNPKIYDDFFRPPQTETKLEETDGHINSTEHPISTGKIAWRGTLKVTLYGPNLRIKIPLEALPVLYQKLTGIC